MFLLSFWNITCGSKICGTSAVARAKTIPAKVAQDLLDTTNSDPDFLKKVITEGHEFMAMTLKQMANLRNVQQNYE